MFQFQVSKMTIFLKCRFCGPWCIGYLQKNFCQYILRILKNKSAMKRHLMHWYQPLTSTFVDCKHSKRTKTNALSLQCTNYTVWWYRCVVLGQIIKVSQWSRTEQSINALGCEFACVTEQNAPHFGWFATQTMTLQSNWEPHDAWTENFCTIFF